MTLPVAFNYYDYPKKEIADHEDKNGVYVCNVCGKSFHGKASLTVHLNTHEFNSNLDGKVERDVRNTCNMCLKKFSAKKNLLKHLRDVHKNFSEAERMVVKKMKCPEKNCKFLCRMMKELRSHIEKSHKIKILKDMLQFPSETVFQKWKKEEESNTVSWFVTGRKKTTLMDGTKKQTLYCHRTGHYNPKGFGKYRMRSVGSCKIGVTCPAAMEVIELPDGGITVVYYKTHLGHMQDVIYLKLSTEERAYLAEKIKQGFSFDAILEDIKESRNFDKEKKKKIHLLSKKDLYSIMRTVNCGNRKAIRKGDEDGINKSGVKSKENESNSFGLENVMVGRTDEETPQTTPESVQTYKSFEENLLMQQKYKRHVNNPESSSQIVIVSPDADCSSVAEIILLSANETLPAQPEQSTIEKTEPANHPDDKDKTSNLHQQLEEKLHKISEVLPQSEYLTPKQFDLIHAKLNAILDIFNVAKEKANARRPTSRKKAISRGRVFKTNDSIKTQEKLFGQSLPENPQNYTTYN